MIQRKYCTLRYSIFVFGKVGSAEAWSFKNTALAAQTYILACTAHGLATGPMEGFDARR